MLLVFAIEYLFYENLWMLVALLPLGYYYFCRCIHQEEERCRQVFEKQFQDALQSLETQLSVGYSMENAIREVQKDLRFMYQQDSLITREFTYMVRQLNLNVTAEQVWTDLAKRVKLQTVDSFVTVFILAKRSGGDSLLIIRNAVEQLGDKAEMKREIETVLSSKRLEFRIMSVVPFGIMAYIKISFAELVGMMYGNMFGICFMSICLGTYIAAWQFGNKIIEIEVQ